MSFFKKIKSIFSSEDIQPKKEDKIVQETPHKENKIPNKSTEAKIVKSKKVEQERIKEFEKEMLVSVNTYKSPYDQSPVKEYYKNLEKLNKLYKNRDKESVYVVLISICEKTISLMKGYPSVFKDLINNGIKCMPPIEKYILLLRSHGEYEKAIEICDFAIDFGVPSHGEEYFQKKKSLLSKDIEKRDNPKTENKVNKKNKQKRTTDNTKEDNLPSLNTTNISKSNLLDKWNISISFGKSTSSNYNRAVFLAKQAPLYDETGEGKEIAHQAIYSSSESDFLSFINLYELVGKWKSTFIFINGNLVNKKDVGELKYCYGDRCRSGNKDFCFGASEFTINPFGCHRLQVSLGNHPWWTFGEFDNNDIWHIDKKAILERFESQEKPYSDICPVFYKDRILAALEALPETIDIKKDKRFIKSDDSIFCIKPFLL